MPESSPAPLSRAAGDETLDVASLPPDASVPADRSLPPDRSLSPAETQDVSPASGSATRPSFGAQTSFAGQNTIDVGDKTFVRGATSPASTIHVGSSRKQFGEYELVRELARGGMGVVYEAIQTRLKRTVAIKMILAGEFASDEQIQRFFAEARSVANLDHPNIVPIYEVAEQSGQHFFSMKLVDGGSLSSRLYTFAGQFRRTAELVEKVARAVHHAHQRGVLHRDLKPGNILLDRDGEPMVTDFGLAKIVADDSNMTRSDAVVGTPAYMAPEQVLGARFTTTSTDIWALGIILYQLLAQAQPFKGETSHETLRLVMENEPARPRQHDPKIPRDLETICLKCLQKEQARRYTSAEALANDLRRFLAGEPVEARPVSAPERLWRWCRRNPGLAITGGAAVLAATAAIIILSVAVALISDREQKAQKLADDNANLLINERALSRARERDNVNLRLEQAVKQCELDASVGLLMLARVLQEAEAIDAPDLATSTRLQLTAWGQSIHPLQTIVRHEPAGAGGVRLVALSSDGSTAFTHGADNHVRAFNAMTGKSVGQPLNCLKPASAIGVDPATGLLLIAFQDGMSRWWHPDSGKPLPPAAPSHTSGVPITAIAFAGRSGKVLTCAQDGIARLWLLRSGQQVGSDFNFGGPITACAVSENANCVAIGGPTESDVGNTSVVRLWNLASGKPLSEAKQFGRVWGISFRDLGQQVVVVSQTGATTYNARDGQPVATLRQPGGGTFAITLSPDGTRAVTAELGNVARVMTLAAPTEVRVPLRHGNVVTAQAFSGDGRFVITGCGDGLARIWRVSGDPPSGTLAPAGAPTASLSTSGKLVAVVTADGAVMVADAGKSGVRARLAENGHVVSAAISPDDRYVLAGSSDDTASLWEIATAKRIGEPMSLGDLVRIVAFSPDGKTFLIAGFGGMAQLRRTSDLSLVGEPIEHEQLKAASFSPDSRYVVTAGEDGVAMVWPVDGARSPARQLHHDARIWAVAFSPDGKRLITGGQDAIAHLWDLESARTIGQLMAHQDEVQMVAFSPTGEWVATGEPSRVIRLWDARTGAARRQPIALGDKPEVLAFSDDGTRLAVGSLDGSVVFWDVVGHRAIGPTLRRSSSVTAVAFSPGGDSAMIATVGGDVRMHSLRPLPGKPADVAGWARRLTGQELDDTGAVRVVDAP